MISKCSLPKWILTTIASLLIVIQGCPDAFAVDQQEQRIIAIQQVQIQQLKDDLDKLSSFVKRNISNDGKWLGSPSGLKGDPGPQGPQGPQGVRGDAGAVGPKEILETTDVMVVTQRGGKSATMAPHLATNIAKALIGRVSRVPVLLPSLTQTPEQPVIYVMPAVHSVSVVYADNPGSQFYFTQVGCEN